MSSETIPKMAGMRPGETENAAVSLHNRLEKYGESLTGTPTVTTEVESGDDDELDEITVSDPAVNTLIIQVEGRSVAASRAVTFNVVLSADATVGTVYRLTVTTTTTPTARTLIEEMLLRVI